MKKVLLILIFYITCDVSLLSQPEYSNWYFGLQSGITFNAPNGNPISYPGNRLGQFEGVATISNKNGNVLIYSNGEFVVNRNGSIVNIGNPLFGHQSSCQAAIILPKPGSTNLYYVFTSDAGEYTGSTNRGIHYSVFDINANLGQGAFVEMNVPLQRPASEQLSACYHANGNDVWVVARGWKNNNFYSFLLTDQGISDTVITSIGFTRTNDFHTIGCLKFSPNGNIAVAPVYDEQFFEIFKFDNKTGEFYNRLQINVADQVTLYGAEFSSNGKVLYISASKNSFGFYSVYQYNISDYNGSKISQSQIRVGYKEGHIGTLQRGINNKIYVAPLNSKYLHSIESPNTLGSNCRFQERTVELFDSLSQLGLPPVFKPAPNFRNIITCEDNNVILDTDEFLADTLRYPFSYKWRGPNDWESTKPVPVLNSVKMADSGDYVLSVTYTINGSPFTTNYTITLKVGGHLSFKINGPNTICKGFNAFLTADTINPNFSYLWSNGRRANSISTNQSGIYKLYITNQFGCVDSAIHKLTVVDPPVAVISGNKLLCGNQSVKLTSVNQLEGDTFFWSTGENSPEILVSQPGVYKLILTNQFGCKDTAVHKVVKYPNMKLKIMGDTVLCVPGTADLIASINPFDSTLNHKFIWSTNDSTSKITVNKPGTYKVTVIIENTCVYSDSIVIRKSDSPDLKMNVNSYNELCNGESLIANVLNKNSTYKYYWQDGSRNFPRLIKTSGEFTVTVENLEGCYEKFDFKVVIKDKPVAEIRIKENTNICNADSIVLNAYPKSINYKYQWIGYNNSDSLIIRQSGTYFLVVTNEVGCSDTASISLDIGKGLPVKISGNNISCKNELITLKANVNISGSNDGLTYIWSTGETTSTINPTKDGIYSVLVSHSSGCEGKDSILVKYLELPKVTLNISENITLCEGDSVEIYPVDKNNEWEYFWSDGSIANKKTIKESGTYKVFVYNQGLCPDSSEILISFIESPVAKIISDLGNKVCTGASITLKSNDEITENKYLWLPNNVESTSLNVNKTGWYFLVVSNSVGCKSIDSILILPAEEPTLSMIVSKPFLCQGDSLFINAGGNFEHIIWSNGDTNKRITVYEPGVYTATVFSKDKCAAQNFIEVFHFSGSIQLKYKKPDFGIICPGTSMIKDLEIINNSNLDIELLSLILSNDIDFNTLLDIKNVILPASESLLLPVKFIPNMKGDYSTEIKLVYNHGCLDSTTLFIDAKSNFESKISLPDISGESGSKICIPITYKFECADSVNIITSAIAKISFNAEYFIPDSLTLGKIIKNEIINHIRFVEIEFKNLHLTKKEGILDEICGSLLIGYDTASPLIINDFQWDDPLKITLKNGSIKTELCAIDLRPIQLFKPTNLSISPNPASDFMNINVISEEKGIFVLELINYQGNIINSIEWSRSVSDLSVKDFKLNTENISSGVYTINLRSPWNTISSKVIIVK